MKRLESNLLNMVLSLTFVAVVAAVLLGGLYVITAEPIARQKAEKQQSAITEVLPAIEGLTISEGEEKDGMTFYKAYLGEEQQGVAVQTEGNGFGGKFKVMVGFDNDGNVVNYKVLEHQETPGLGDHMTTWFKTDKNNQSIIGKSPEKGNFTVSKDGGDIDAITAATISSRAFLKAVCEAYTAYAETHSGASTLKKEAICIPETEMTDEAAGEQETETDVEQSNKEQL